MKLILQDNKDYILRFDKGEEVLAGITAFMQQQGIKACTFSAIGACSEVDLEFFNPFVKEYRKKPYVEQFEIVSLTGNGSLVEDQPSVHAHGVFGRNDFTVLAGHASKIVAVPTCEVALTKLDGEMKREKNADYNLNLLS